MATSVLLKLLVMGLIVGPGDVARTLSHAAFYLFVPALLFRNWGRRWCPCV